jgi:SPP1 family predicted phage head-tail adaptor
MAGKLSRRLRIERRDTTQDASNAQATSWTKVADIWGGIAAQGGREILSGAQIRPENERLITIRYWPGLTAKDRLVYTDAEGVEHFYNITRISDIDEKHRVVEILAVEGLATG